MRTAQSRVDFASLTPAPLPNAADGAEARDERAGDVVPAGRPAGIKNKERASAAGCWRRRGGTQPRRKRRRRQSDQAQEGFALVVQHDAGHADKSAAC